MITTTPGQRAETVAQLREDLPPGTLVHVVVRSVARSGMSRRMTLHYVSSMTLRCGLQSTTDNPLIVDCTRRVSQVCGWSLNDAGEMLVQGCGMDMGFHAVYTLAQVLHGDGYALSHHYI